MTGWRRRVFGGVRGRVTFAVLAVTAVVYSLLGTVGFLAIADSSRDAIRERVGVVLDDLERSVRNGSGAVRVTTPDGVAAVAVSPDAVPQRAADGVIEVRRTIDVVGTELVLIGRASEAPLTDSLRSLYRGLWIGVPLAAVVSAALAGIATRRALRPVGEITNLADSIDGTVSEQRVPVPDTDDEVHDLTLTLNRMLDRIAATTQAQRRFTSDAAHELRTPLMAVLGELELASVHRAPLDSAFVERLQVQADRLGARIDDLVLLATLDEGRPARVSRGRLHDLVAEEAAMTTPRPEVGGDDGVAEFDALLMARAVRNLLSNAARHAADRVRATVVDDAASPHVWVHVDDDGPGIPPTEREAVLGRFTRLDEARTGRGGGAGLGLSIVVSVAAAHGGGVRIDDSPLGGARVSMWLPRVANVRP